MAAEYAYAYWQLIQLHALGVLIWVFLCRLQSPTCCSMAGAVCSLEATMYQVGIMLIDEGSPSG